MELKEFINQTLVQLIEGVKLAQNQTRSLDGEINPYLPEVLLKDKVLDSRMFRLGGTVEKNVFFIDFDVAVTVIESDNIKGGGSINVAAIKLGAGGESNTTNTQQSRIKFIIPITLPDSRGQSSQ
jgi:hypothetical protein